MPACMVRRYASTAARSRRNSAVATCSARGAQAPTWPRKSFIRAMTAGAPATQPTRSPVRRERFGDPVEEDHERRRLRHQGDRVPVAGRRERQGAVHLVEQHEQGPRALGLPPDVLRHHGLHDGPELGFRNHGAGGVGRRAETEEPGPAEMRGQLRRASAGSRRPRSVGDRDRPGLGQIGVVIVVPGGHRIHHGVAGIDHRPKERVDPGRPPPAMSDRLDRIGHVLLDLEVLPDRLSEHHHAVGRRIIGFAASHRVGDGLAEPVRNWELVRVEIADGQVADRLARGDQGADRGGDLENGRPAEPARERGKRSIELRLVAEVEGGGGGRGHGRIYTLGPDRGKPRAVRASGSRCTFGPFRPRGPDLISSSGRGGSS